MDKRHGRPDDLIWGMTVPRPVPAAKNAPTSSGSPTVAESPMRRGMTPAMRESRSIRHSVCPPRSARKSECTSSMTT